jgi:hypothetical protein
MKSTLLILVGFFIAAVLASMLSLSYLSSQRERPVDRMYVIDDSSFFCSQNSSSTDVAKERIRVIDDPNDPFGQKLRETLIKYNVSREEWETNTGNAWTRKWEIIKELNQWQMENN